jgi:hypothetical protein
MPTYSEYQKGISQGKNIQQGFYSLTNSDVHTSLGEEQCNLALVSESTTPNEPCLRAEAPNGDVYFFSNTSGKTWKRTSGASYSLVNTNANGAHLGCQYFNGYIYYATTTKLGRYDLSSTWSDSFGTFTNGASYKPMYEKNLSLFIGDGKYVAAVDNTGNFSFNVLDLTPEHTVTALTGSSYDLLIGTMIGANVKRCGAFLWDTYSPSWTSDDMIPDNGVNCFIDGDGLIYASIGTSGWIYYWTGGQMKRFFKLRDTTTHGDQLSTVHNGRPMFAVGTKVYSLHRESESFPYAVVHEYTATQGTIKSIISTGSQLLVSNGSNIDKIGTDYATAVIETPEAIGKFNKVIVSYYSLGGGTIGIETKVDGGEYVAGTVSVDDIRKTVSLEGGVGDCNFIQARITLTPSGANNIIIKGITIE